MKKTQFIELLATIRATAVSFFSILMFVALGVGVYLGIAWAGPALYTAIDSELSQANFHHFQLIFPYGINEEVIERIEDVEGVVDVEGVYVSVQTLESKEGSHTVKLQSLPGDMDVVTVVEGELPSSVGQIAVIENYASTHKLKVGDELVVSGNKEGDGLSDEVTTLEVVGIVHAPEYLSSLESAYGQSGRGAGALDGIGYVVPECFEPGDFDGGYPILNVRASITPGLSTFDDAYRQESDAIQQRIEAVVPELSVSRFEEVKQKAQSKVDEGRDELEKAKQELADAKKKVEEGERELEKLRKMVADGEAAIAKGERELQQGREQLADGERRLAEAEAEFKRQKAIYQEKLDEAKEQLNMAREALDKARSLIESNEAAVQRAEDAVPNIIGILQQGLDDKRALDDQLAAGEITQEEWLEGVLAISLRLPDEVQAEVDSSGIVSYDMPEIDAEDFETSVEGAIALLNELFNTGNLTIWVDLGDGTYTEASLNEVRDGIATAKEMLSEYEAKYAEAKAEYDAAKAEFDRKVSYYQAKLDEAHRKVERGRAQIAEGERRLAEAKRQVAEGKQAIADGEKQLEEAKRQIAEAEDKIAEGEEELEAAESRIAELREYTISVLPRSSNGGIASAAVLGRVTENLSFSMAGLFVVVGLLVCYSAVSRIVHEQVVLIGTKKALGLRSREITISFLAYSTAAVIVGAIVGTIVGVIAVEGIINPALGGRFVMDAYPPYFSLPHMLAISGIELALVLGATWIACSSILKRQAMELLRGPKPPATKERFFEKWSLWKKLPLLTQTMVNNVLNDKRRVFSTVVGVAGATALIVTAITLNDDVLLSYDRHYENVYGFDTIVYVDGESERAATCRDLLDDEGVPYASVRFQAFAIDPVNGQRDVARVFIPTDQEEFEQLYHVIPIEGAPLDLSREGVWVSRAYAEHQGAKVGDELVLDAGDGLKHRFEILGFYDFYLTAYEVIMGPETYERALDSEPTANALLLNTGGQGAGETKRVLGDEVGRSSIVNDKSNQHHMFVSFSSISRTVVMVYLALAALMAVVVLLNLNTMFIEEKKRELIVLMINGFSVHDAQRYIYNDSIVLTAIGIILGIVVGIIVGAVTVGSVEPQTSVFVKDVALRAVLVGGIGAAILSSIMGAIALRRIPRFKLTDINRM